MGRLALAAALFIVFGVALHLFAAKYAERRCAGDAGPMDRTLARTLRRTTLLYLVAVLAALLVYPWRWLAPGDAAEVAVLAGAPLLLGWGAVAGASFVEIRGRGLNAGLWRFHLFNLFTAHLLVGQRIPWFSAALVTPAGGERALNLILHFGLALVPAAGLAWAIRILLARLLAVRSLPDARLAVEVRAVAREAGIKLRGVLLVPTEPGQSVNALAATSSRYIFVAQGLYEGLDRAEVRAVLLHEVGHLGQTVQNLWRGLTFVAWPALLFLFRVSGANLAGHEQRIALAACAAAAVILATVHVMLAERAERDADRFAVEHGGKKWLASALRRIYALGPPVAGGRPARKVAGVLAKRLRRIESAGS